MAELQQESEPGNRQAAQDARRHPFAIEQLSDGELSLLHRAVCAEMRYRLGASRPGEPRRRA